MVEHFLEAPNLPFSAALLVMLGLGLLEGASAVAGLGLSSFLDSLLPGHAADVDLAAEGSGADLGAQIETPGFFTRTLRWLHVGRVPLLILLVVFLLGFGLTGLVLQAVLDRIFGFMLPASVAAVPALLLTLPWVRVAGGILGRLMPRDETSAVSSLSFIGNMATIVAGEAAQGRPSQGKLQDRHGQTHYMLVEPEDGQGPFVAGQAVMLVRQSGAVFFAVKDPYPELSNPQP